MEIRCLYIYAVKWWNIPDVCWAALSICPRLYPTNRHNTFMRFCRHSYISTYSHACIIQSIDTARVDVSDAKCSGSIVAIIILMASFVSFPASCNVLRTFMLTVAFVWCTAKVLRWIISDTSISGKLRLPRLYFHCMTRVVSNHVERNSGVIRN